LGTTHTRCDIRKLDKRAVQICLSPCRHRGLLKCLLLGLLPETEQPFRCCNPLCPAAERCLVCQTLRLEHRCWDLGPKAEETLPKLTEPCSAELICFHSLQLGGDVCLPLCLCLLRKELLGTELLPRQTLPKATKELRLGLLLAGGRKQGFDVCLTLLLCKARAELALPNILGLGCQQCLQVLRPLLLPEGSTKLKLGHVLARGGKDVTNIRLPRLLSEPHTKLPDVCAKATTKLPDLSTHPKQTLALLGKELLSCKPRT